MRDKQLSEEHLPSGVHKAVRRVRNYGEEGVQEPLCRGWSANNTQKDKEQLLTQYSTEGLPQRFLSQEARNWDLVVRPVM